MYVQIKNLTREFGDLKAVDNLSFEFDTSQIFGFVGPNGSGKTTTMRILATLDSPTYGDTVINGYSTVVYPEKVRQLIGFMPDYYNAYPNMVVWEYLDFFARAYGFKRQERVNRVSGVMDFTDLNQLRDKSIDTLSKGMKQRLCLARALIHDPNVLILDEPAAGLDPRARIELRELLKVLRDQKRAVFISSHILTELSEICDGVAIIEKGSLITAGTVKEIQRKLSKGDSVKQKMVEVSLAGQLEEGEKFLLEQPEVGHVRLVHDSLHCTLQGGEEDQINLLKKLVEKGFPVLEYRSYRETLEDMFMKLTKGEIQ